MQSGHSFTKSGYFFNFGKRAGETLPFLLSSYLPELLFIKIHMSCDVNSVGSPNLFILKKISDMPILQKVYVQEKLANYRKIYHNSKEKDPYMLYHLHACGNRTFGLVLYFWK